MRYKIQSPDASICSRPDFPSAKFRVLEKKMGKDSSSSSSSSVVIHVVDGQPVTSSSSSTTTGSTSSVSLTGATVFETSYSASSSSSSNAKKCKKEKKAKCNKSSSESCAKPCVKPCAEQCYKVKNVCYVTSGFTAIVTPLTSLTPSSVQFRMRRKNKSVTLMWQGFAGTLSALKAYLLVSQSIINLPPWNVSFLISGLLNGDAVNFKMVINTADSEIIKIYLKQDEQTDGLAIGNEIEVDGGAVTWITDEDV